MRSPASAWGTSRHLNLIAHLPLVRQSTVMVYSAFHRNTVLSPKTQISQTYHTHPSYLWYSSSSLFPSKSWVDDKKIRGPSLHHKICSLFRSAKTAWVHLHWHKHIPGEELWGAVRSWAYVHPRSGDLGKTKQNKKKSSWQHPNICNNYILCKQIKKGHSIGGELHFLCHTHNYHNHDTKRNLLLLRSLWSS